MMTLSAPSPTTTNGADRKINQTETCFDDSSLRRRVARKGDLTACALILLSVIETVMPARAQQKTGPGVPADDRLIWRGITLYGVIDIGLQYDAHGAPFSPYRPAASGNIVRQNSHQSVIGLTPSNMGQSRVGLQGHQPLFQDWSAVFQMETFFNPQSGEVADSLKSLAVNNGRPLSAQSVAVDGSSAGQALQTAFLGLQSPRLGTVTVGRQVSLLSQGTIQYDPNYNATAFGLLGASNTYSGGGSSEDNRLDSSAKYRISFEERAHLAALYKFNQSHGSARSAVQINLGGVLGEVSVDAYYSQVNGSISASPLTAGQLAALPPAYSPSTSLAATVSDNTAYALMGSYRLQQFKLFGGYEYIKYANPRTPLSIGYRDIGDYVLASVNNTAYNHSKLLQVYWTGVRYTPISRLELTMAYYGVHQDAYGTASQAGCVSSAHSSCSGRLEAFSLDLDYRFNVHFDIYAGAMRSAVHQGLASGYIYTTNVNPTIGGRYKF